MQMSSLPKCMHVYTCMSGTHRGQRKVSDSLELEFLVVESYMRVQRTEPGESTKKASALHCRAILSDPGHLSLFKLSSWV